MVPDIKDLRLKANETIAGQLLAESSQCVGGGDRPITLSSDLIEAQSRISNLEAVLAQDRRVIEGLSAELGASGMRPIN